MAITSIFETTVAICLADLPVKTDEIGAITTPVKTSTIDLWIDQSSGIIWSILNGKGITFVANDNDLQLFQRGVVAFVGSKVLSAMNRGVGLQVQLWDEWKETLDIIKARPDLIGDTGDQSSGVRSNIDTDNPSRRTFGNYNNRTKRNGFRGW